MNIFHLDPDLETSVRYYLDDHVVKMITEHMQMMFDVFHFLDPVNYPYWDICKPFAKKDGTPDYRHRNHPSTIWVRESLSNWRFLKRLSQLIEIEWRHRYGHPETKRHQSMAKIEMLPEPNIPDLGLTPMRMAINDDWAECIVPGDYIQSYRNYYNTAKKKLSVKETKKNKVVVSKRPAWKNREIPHWFNFDQQMLEV